MTEEASGFLDVEALLESSEPRPGGTWLWYAAGAFLLLILVSSYLAGRSIAGPWLVELVSTMSMMALVGGMGYMAWAGGRAVIREQQQVEAIEELVLLRRWSEAAEMLRRLLSRPARTPQARVQSLVYLASVLGRYHRWADAITVYEYLLDLDVLDPDASYGLQLGRAMAMLHEERLFDVDRVIGELRRQCEGRMPGGLALVEIYRDVKTGHPQEAIELFELHQEAMRRQLGMRVADAHALVARAYDLVGRPVEAAAAYERATLLAPEAELSRRYAEVAAIAGKYAAAQRPERQAA